MIQKYRILERTWSNHKNDYVVQEYSKKWYSKKYKWRTMKQISGIWSADAIFSSKEEAEQYIRESTIRVVNSRVVREYS